MRKARIALLIALVVSGCAGNGLAVAQGPWKQQNPDKWTPTQAELDALPR